MASTAGSPAALEDNTEYLHSVGGNYTGSKAPPTSEVVCLHQSCLNRKASGAGPSTCICGLTGAEQAAPLPPMKVSGCGRDQHSNGQGCVQHALQGWSSHRVQHSPKHSIAVEGH